MSYDSIFKYIVRLSYENVDIFFYGSAIMKEPTTCLGVKRHRGRNSINTH
jgi:hypothetical protein